jgi:hypothetical protein
VTFFCTILKSNYHKSNHNKGPFVHQNQRGTGEGRMESPRMYNEASLAQCESDVVVIWCVLYNPFSFSCA